MIAKYSLLLTFLLSTCSFMEVVSFIALKSFPKASSYLVCDASTSVSPDTAINTIYPLKNDLIIRASKGEKIERTPVWLFRQAGRHLPEYNAYKESRKKNFLELLEDPVDVAECTLQPVRRYNVDAAILFSDILVILQALGMEVTMPGGVGITVPSPLLSPSEVRSRLPKNIDVKEKLSHVIEAVKLIKSELKGKVPLIGFSAAPFSLMYYMVGGSTKKNQETASNWLNNHPTESKELLDLLTHIVIDYTSAQIEAGADLVQIFEAMGDFISPDNFSKWALPSMAQIARELKAKHPSIPLLVFPRGATYALADLQSVGYDVVTLDTKTERRATRDLLKSRAEVSTPPRKTVSSVQGNFDVAKLKLGASSSTDIEIAVKQMLEELGPSGLIANLGEGLTGSEDPALVTTFVDSIHTISEKLLSNNM